MKLKILFILIIAILFQIGIISFTYKNYPDHYLVKHYARDLSCWFDMFKKLENGQYPIIDYEKEYPSGAITMYLLLRGFYFSDKQFIISHGLFMLAVFIASFIYLSKLIEPSNPSCKIWAYLVYAFSPTILILNHIRFDIVPVVLTLAGFYYYRKKKLYLPSILLGIATSIKWFPVFIIIAIGLEEILHHKDPKKAIKIFLISFIAYAIVDIPFIIINLTKYGNIQNWLYTYTARAQQAPYSDTPIGLLRIFYEIELPNIYPTLVTLGLLLLVTILPYPKEAMPRYILYCLVFLLFNKIYSPQFHLWFLPFLLLYIAWISPSPQPSPPPGAPMPGAPASAGRGSEERVIRFGFIVVIIMEILNIAIYPFSFSLILRDLGDFSLGRLFPISSFNIFTISIILRAIILVYLIIYIYKTAISPKPFWLPFYKKYYLAINSFVIISVLSLLGIHIFRDNKPLNKLDPLPRKTFGLLQGLFTSIRNNGVVSTSSSLYPYLKKRFRTNIFRPQGKHEYILLPIENDIPDRWKAYYKKLLIDLLADKRYGLRASIPGYILLEKGFSSIKNQEIAKEIFGTFQAEKLPKEVGANSKDLSSRFAVEGTPPGYLIYGPYIPSLPGKYVVAFKMRTKDNTKVQTIAKIDVVGQIGQRSYAEREMCGKDFRKPDVYQEFKLEFTLKGYDRLEFRVYYSGIGQLYVDCIKIDSTSLTLENMVKILEDFTHKYY